MATSLFLIMYHHVVNLCALTLLDCGVIWVQGEHLKMMFHILASLTFDRVTPKHELEFKPFMKQPKQPLQSTYDTRGFRKVLLMIEGPIERNMVFISKTPAVRC